ncbi:hypothetical protein [Nitrosopumilus sp.]|uniref:hypothetical protein n=1 Tax=Nitrosopumilus sp. TaxID=2024843 RepID=UPI003B5CDE93
MSSFDSNTATRTRSGFWYVLPIFVGIIGGAISWLAIRYDDPKKARNCLILGAVLTAIPIILTAIPFVLLSTVEPPIEPFYPEYNPPIKFLDDFTI